MIDLGILPGLLEHEHTIAAHCARCGRWSVLPLAELVANGQGSRRLPIKVRCHVCGDHGELQVRPKVPTLGFGGWMEPPGGQRA